jgi:hypothetical protein
VCALLPEQIKIIATEIHKKKDEVQGAGLLSGKAGVTLMYAYLSKVFPAA